MEKKKWETPVVEVIHFNFEDQIVASSGYEPTNPTKPGHGWGDKNHDHEHWKDRIS